MNLEFVCQQFFPKCKLDFYEEIKVGHINKTYKAVLILENSQKLVVLVQAVNTFVFKKPKLVMENIARTTEHIQKKNPDGCNLTFYKTVKGKNYFEDENGFWRLVNYVNSDTYSSGVDLEIVANAAKAFGQFQNQLSDFPAEELHETIPDFHNTIQRFKNLWNAVEKNSHNRAKDVQKELDYARSIEEKACTLSRLYNEGKLPLRVTHNDTKINNVLFKQNSKEALVVIDLDTVMPGLVGHDFGDALRTAANTQAENCSDYDKIDFNLDIYKAFYDSYLQELDGKLTQLEIETLPLSCFCMTIECGIRFLTDYLEGDVYFRTAYPEHNLVRTKAQFALADKCMKKLNI